jgi:DNA-binding transcriptional MocR family regulator/dihydrodipicolinate reductase
MYTQYSVPVAKDKLNLGVGQPSPNLLRWSDFQKSMVTLNEPNCEIMQYGYIPGFQEYRDTIRKMLQDLSDDNYVKSEDIFMTNGISQAVFMLASLLKKDYKKVYVQDPTYFIMLNIFRELNYNFDVFNLDNLDYLNDALQDDLQNNIKSLIYLIPFNCNPTGNSITLNETLQLEHIIKKYKDSTLLLSDETYQFLNFNQSDNFLSLASKINSENIISLGTFSKLIAPALRLGWIYTKNQYIHKMLNNCGFMDSGGAVNQMMGKMLCHYLQNYDIKNIIKDNMTFLENNCTKICTILEKYSEHFEWKKPKGGYFVWVKCKTFDCQKFQKICADNNLNFHRGIKFSPFNNFQEYFRLSFSYYNINDYNYLDERLAISIKEYNMITINILGANGRLGNLICKEAATNSNFVVNKVNRELDNIITKGNSIIVDVSSIEGTNNLVNELINKKYSIPLIIGTTGNLPIDLINKYKKNYCEKVLVCSNFSIGVSSINKYLEELMPNYWCINIEEQHHVNKKDAPSGTAKTFLNIAQNNIINKDCTIESVREGDIIGYHKIHLFNDYEELTIIHNAKDRALFAKGCLEYVKKMIN